MHRGYIKIWRKIEDSFLMSDPDALWLWIRLLLKANHKPKDFLFNGKVLTLNRGQLLTGRKSLVDKHKISESKVYRLLKTFESEHLIEQQKTNLYSIITIVCYDDYQSLEQVSEQPVNNQRTTSEQPVNTNNTFKNEKNDNITISEKSLVKKKPSDSALLAKFEEAWKMYPRKEGRADAIRHFKAQVTNAENWDLLLDGIDKYIKHIEINNVQPKFIKHGGTFFNQEWKDWGRRQDL